MENYFQSYPDKKTVGFLTTTLWQNDFRETVLKAKNKYKAMKRNNEL